VLHVRGFHEAEDEHVESARLQHGPRAVVERHGLVLLLRLQEEAVRAGHVAVVLQGAPAVLIDAWRQSARRRRSEEGWGCEANGVVSFWGERSQGREREDHCGYFLRVSGSRIRIQGLGFKV